MVGYWVGRLEETGYLKGRGRWAGFDLMQPALTLLSRADAGEKTCAPTIRHEHGGWKYKVVAREKKPVDWRKVEGVRNWDDFILSEKFRGIVRKVELHDKTREGPQIIIYSGPLEGDTDEELDVLARQTCNLLAAHLQEKYEMRLDLDHPKPLRPEAGEWAPNVADPAVKALVDANGQIRTREFNMDDSPHKGVGEIDFKGKRGAELAKLYVRATVDTPRQLDRVQESQTKLETRIDGVEEKMNAIADSMSKIADAMVSTSKAVERVANLHAKTLGQDDKPPETKSLPEPNPRCYT